MNPNVSTPATTLDNPLAVFSLPRAVRARLEDSITGKLQIMAASLVQGYETEIDQHEEKIRQLRDYITRVKEICNSLVHQPAASGASSANPTQRHGAALA